MVGRRRSGQGGVCAFLSSPPQRKQAPNGARRAESHALPLAPSGGKGRGGYGGEPHPARGPPKTARSVTRAKAGGGAAGEKRPQAAHAPARPTGAPRSRPAARKGGGNSGTAHGGDPPKRSGPAGPRRARRRGGAQPAQAGADGAGGQGPPTAPDTSDEPKSRAPREAAAGGEAPEGSGGRAAAAGTARRPGHPQKGQAAPQRSASTPRSATA